MTANRSSSPAILWPYDNPRTFHPFRFESVDDAWWKQFMADHTNLPFVISVVYLITIFGGQRLMRQREPFRLNHILAGWNLVLGAFSIFGGFRIGQELFHVVRLNGFYRSVCIREGYNEPTAFWGLLFVLSKFVELGDTIFIVLRKQPLILLQWWHHSITLIFVWKVFPYSEPIQRFYGVMNFAVHGLMYNYFALRAMKVRVPKLMALSLTSLQFAQMLVGILVNVYSVHVMRAGQFCARTPHTLKWSLGVYASFAVLFAEFLFSRYFVKSKGKKTD